MKLRHQVLANNSPFLAMLSHFSRFFFSYLFSFKTLKHWLINSVSSPCFWEKTVLVGWWVGEVVAASAREQIPMIAIVLNFFVVASHPFLSLEFLGRLVRLCERAGGRHRGHSFFPTFHFSFFFFPEDLLSPLPRNSLSRRSEGEAGGRGVDGSANKSAQFAQQSTP